MRSVLLLLLYSQGRFKDKRLLVNGRLLLQCKPFCSSILLIWISFISFSSLIAMAKTTKSMLNNSGENGQPCLVPDLSGNVFSFSPLSMMLAVG